MKVAFKEALKALSKMEAQRGEGRDFLHSNTVGTLFFKIIIIAVLTSIKLMETYLVLFYGGIKHVFSFIF